ncbi:MAG: MBL fold metallo-hydrolase [Clostridiaceae bacterium]|jgi:L-ascorbate metabolism protein UlaG (beta-lactamase superfamily)|nr:MBL fold metallo-hydrolase [Clostridiaceae bacterium]
MAITRHDRVTVQWLGHSCFRIDNGTNSIVIDPYNDKIGYPALHTRASMVTASHGHGDHNCFEAVERLPYETDPDAAITVENVETFHDAEGGTARGKNKVQIVHTGGFSIVHLGDLGHLLSDEQAAAIGQPDLLLIPVGGFYTIDATQAAATVRQLQPGVVIPMHYRHAYGPDQIAPVDDFLDAMREEFEIMNVGSDIIALDRSLFGKVLVLRYRQA